MDTSSQPSASTEMPPSHSHPEPSHAYAFLVHSQSTLDNDLPPKVDNKTLARQKRRRTSPEDHAILEAEYQKNSKPDKAARAEIVRKVSLEEKAVQIWFQNRRQNDRRKSRPLLPHELIPHLRNPPPGPFQTHHAFSCDGSSSPFHSHSQEAPVAILSSSPVNLSVPIPSPVEERAPSRGSSIQDLLNPVDEKNTDKAPLSFSSSSTIPTSPLSHPANLHNGNISTTSIADQNAGGQDRPMVAVDSQNQNKKRAFHDIDTTINASPSLGTPVSTTSSQEKSSGIRLSMSLDGAVRVKTGEEETPSPPKQRLMAPDSEAKSVGALQRSKSEVGLNIGVSEGAKLNAKQPGGSFGRSRDARTWEFFCDSDMRDALAIQAERERSGSAVGAISLIRSQSKKSRENLREQQRREALHPKAGGVNLQRSSSGLGSKPKISRTQSSMGRLQHVKNWSVQQDAKSSQESASKLSKTSHTRRTSGDSDKENWAPGTRDSTHPLRRATTLTTNATRNVLYEGGAPSQNHSHDDTNTVGPKRARTAKRGIQLYDENMDSKENNATESHAQQRRPSRIDGDEIAAFMSSNRSSSRTNIEKDEDMDCIQGLLSLSQGAWR